MAKTFTSAEAGKAKGQVYVWGIVAVILDKFADHIISLDQGWVQTGLTILFLSALAYISHLTVGNIPPEDAEIVRQKVQEMRADELLEEGRN